jgi:hypothetical protein
VLCRVWCSVSRCVHTEDTHIHMLVCTGNEDDMLEYFTDLFLSDIAADGVDR